MSFGFIYIQKNTDSIFAYLKRNYCLSGVMVKASALRAEDCGSNPGRVIPKT